MCRLIAFAVLGFALMAHAQYRADLTANPDFTEAYVAFTTGQVSADYWFSLVNSGTNAETIEHGVDSASAGASWHLDSLANPVNNGFSVNTTVTVYGTGGLFPYWIDYWAQIAGHPETRQVKRLTIDTLASSATRPTASTGRSSARSAARAVLAVNRSPGIARDVIDLRGRVTPCRSTTIAAPVLQQ